MAGPIETGNEGGVDVSVPENRKGRARARIIFTPWGGSGGGDADRRDNGGVPDKKGGGKI